jgi:hypothetical protein
MLSSSDQLQSQDDFSIHPLTAHGLNNEIKATLYKYDFYNPRGQSQLVRHSIIQLMRQVTIKATDMTKWYFDTLRLLKKITSELKQQAMLSENFNAVIEGILSREKLEYVNSELAQTKDLAYLNVIEQVEGKRFHHLIQELEKVLGQRDTTCVFKENSYGILQEIKKQTVEPDFDIKYSSLVLHTTIKLINNPYNEKHRNELKQLIVCAPPKTPDNNLKSLMCLLLGTALMIASIVLTFITFFSAATMMIPMLAKGGLMASEAVGLAMMSVGAYGMFSKKSAKGLTSHMEYLSNIYENRFPVNTSDEHREEDVCYASPRY